LEVYFLKEAEQSIYYFLSSSSISPVYRFFFLITASLMHTSLIMILNFKV
jgi:hypothetical protein